MVVAFDSGVTQMCAARGIVSMPAEVQLEGADFRGNKSSFRLMGSLKPKMVLRLLEEFRFQTVVLTDTDVVWLRDPTGEPNSAHARTRRGAEALKPNISNPKTWDYQPRACCAHAS